MIRKTVFRGLLTVILLLLFRAITMAQTLVTNYPGSGTQNDPYILPVATYGTLYDNYLFSSISGPGFYASLNFFPMPPGLALVPDVLYQLEGTPSSAGTYTITASFNPGTGPYTYYQLTVNPAPLTVTVSSYTKAYGAPMPAAQVSYSGFVFDDNQSFVFGSMPTVTSVATAASGIGKYALQVNNDLLNDPNYAITYQDGTLTIIPDTLTITPNSTNTTYGTAPTLTASYSGFVNGDNASRLTKAPTLAINPIASYLQVGDYSIAASGAVDSNYIILYGPDGILAVEPAQLQISAKDTMTYGGPVPPLTLTYSGFVNGENAGNLTSRPAATTPATSNSTAGSYPITINGAADPNYNILYLPSAMVIEKAVLTVTARDQTMSYGGPVPFLAVRFSGFRNADNVDSIGNLPIASANATSRSPVGDYTIIPSGGSASNYTFNYVDGTLNVVPTTLTVTANPASSTYGTALVPNDSLTLTYHGFVNGEGVNKLMPAPTVTNTAYPGAPAGTYTLTPAGALDPNYNIRYNTGTYTITPANLTVVAVNDTMTYGGHLPATSLNYNGFVNGDGPGSLSVPAQVSTAATPASSVGTYPIVAGGASDPNYNITYMDGTMTIVAATLAVTANNAVMTYGGPVPALSVSYSGFVNGDTTSSLTTAAVATTKATSASAAGTYPVTAGGAVDSNYTFNYIPGTLNIDPAMLSVSADSESKVYGASDPNLNYTVSGLVNGDVLTGSLSRGPGENVGSYPITQGTLSGGSNYVISFTGNVLAITKAPQQITWTQKLLFGCDTTTQYQLTATASSGLPVIYTASNVSAAKVAGDLLTLIQPGTVMITANQPGDSNYLAAANVVDTGIDQSPSLVRQHWNDALFFDNSSDSFVQWQWYKNGHAIPGAVQPFYSETPVLNGQYYVIATETTGETIQTCPLSISGGGAVAGGISVYPNPAAAGGSVSIVCNYPSSALQGAHLEIVDITGKVWQELKNVQPTMNVVVPSIEGIYMISLQLSNGQKATVNVLVGK